MAEPISPKRPTTDYELANQCMKLKPDPIVTEPRAGQTGLCDGVLTALDVRPCDAALIAEPKQLSRRKEKLGHDGAKARE